MYDHEKEASVYYQLTLPWNIFSMLIPDKVTGYHDPSQVDD